MNSPFAYDVVAYPTQALPQAHPSHLYPIARVFGMDPTPPQQCRYLEIGCGDGSHLMACALALPEARFVGIDLSRAAIERGQRMIAEIGLTNVDLAVADLTQWEPPGKFDYVVVHGVYSWVPAPIRDLLLSLVARSLSPENGVGYVSYNTYPGCYVRRMMREMLQFHTDTITDPDAKIAQSLEMLKFLKAGLPEKKQPMTRMFEQEIDDLQNNHDPRVLYHDDLSEVNDPVYVHQFTAHAAMYGLRFVAEAEPNSMAPIAFRPEVAQMLISLAEQDVIMKEQYLDFLRLRRFRQTLLAHDQKKPQAEPDPRGIIRMALSGKPVLQEKSLDLTPGVHVTFTGPFGSAARTDQPLAKAALTLLAQLWPKRILFTDLLARSVNMIGRATSPDENGTLAHMMTLVWFSGMIELHGHIPTFAPSVYYRPIASPLARIQARTGPNVTTMLHATFILEDEASQRLVTMLDGSRSRDDIVAEILAQIPADRRPSPEALAAKITKTLERFAEAGLLVG